MGHNLPVADGFFKAAEPDTLLLTEEDAAVGFATFLGSGAAEV